MGAIMGLGAGRMTCNAIGVARSVARRGLEDTRLGAVRGLEDTRLGAVRRYRTVSARKGLEDTKLGFFRGLEDTKLGAYRGLEDTKLGAFTGIQTRGFKSWGAVKGLEDTKLGTFRGLEDTKLGRIRGLEDTKLGYIVSARAFRTSAGLREKDAKDSTTTTIPTNKKKKQVRPFTPHEQVLNVPNILTFGRLFASPVIGYLVLQSNYPAALALLVTAGITDLLDGWIARKWNLQTVVGSVIDPMADKTLMTILTVTLAMKGLLPVWLAVIILGRDVGLAISAIYYRYISLPPPKTFMRYWDFSLPSAEVRPTMISKVNTVLQMALITACTAYPVLSQDIVNMGAGEVLQGAQYLVAGTTVWSGLSYVGSKSAVKILEHPPPQAEEDGEEEVNGEEAEKKKKDHHEERK